MLGRGSYGVVRLVRDRDGGETYACKTISKDRLSSRRDVEEVRREVELLNLLTPHINVAGLREVFEDQTAIHIILDYCKGASRFSWGSPLGVLSPRMCVCWGGVGGG